MNKFGTPETLAVNRFESSAGGMIYQLPLEEFPGFWGYSYLVLVEHQGEKYRVLIDTGSGFGASNQNLENGIHRVSAELGEELGFENLTHIFITHGHIDHFGGLSYIRPLTPARIGVHELDLRNLTNHEERLIVVARRLETYLVEAGVPEERRCHIIDLYKITKSLYRSVRVDFTYEASGMQIGPFQMLHTPGHCAGHVMIRLHDILFTGDHILNDTSPHQSPEHLTLSTGLEHYLKSLDNVKQWTGDIRLGLGGHKDPILDLGSRIQEIESLHRERLDKVLELLDRPRTVAEVSQALFGEVHGYNVLLALEEAGAHVEYLYQRGLLGINNIQELEPAAAPLAIQYYRLPGES
jgi:glyoxylase-like metal-dependent hydrolase (beta-lactamase superfamily II)